jgi:hypothetical protein
MHFDAMKVGEEAKNHCLAIKNARLDLQPFWGCEDIGAFFCLIVSLGPILRLLARVHFLSRSAMINPSVGLQSAMVVFLRAGRYSVLGDDDSGVSHESLASRGFPFLRRGTGHHHCLALCESSSPSSPARL